MDWPSDNDDFTIPSRAPSLHYSEDISNPEDNDAASIVSDRVDIDSNRFSDASEEDFSDIGETDSNLGNSNLDSVDKGDEAETEPMDIDNEQEDAHSDSESPAGLSTPALDRLKAELLGEYKCPAQAPHSSFIIAPLDSVQKLSLLHYIAWQTSGGTVKAYKFHAKVLGDATGLSILSLFRVQRLAMCLTRLTPRKVDMCLNSCIA